MSDYNLDIKYEIQKALELSHQPQKDAFSGEKVPLGLIDACKRLKTLATDLQQTSGVVPIEIASRLRDHFLDVLDEFKRSLLLEKATHYTSRVIEELSIAADLLDKKISTAREQQEYDDLKANVSTALKKAADAETNAAGLLNRLTIAEKKLDSKEIPELEREALKAKEEIQNHLDSIRGLADKTATEAVTISYSNFSTEEKELSNKYRKYSIIAMCGVSFIASLSLIESIFYPADTSSIAIRISSTILLSLPAAYFARESARHRNQQYTYQQFALNLNALDPFISNMSEIEKSKIKGEVARALFTSSHQHGIKTEQNHPVNSPEVLAAIISKMEFKPALTNEEKPNPQQSKS